MDLLRIYAERLLVEGAKYVGAMLFVLALLFIFRRWARVRIIQQARNRWSRAVPDLAHSVQSVLIFAASGSLVVIMARAGIGHLSTKSWPLFIVALAAIAMIVAHDAYFYWTHRLLHSRQLFRLVHRQHHLSRAPTVFTAYNFSVGEALVHGAFGPIYLLLFPANVTVLIIFGVHQIARNALAHCGHEIFPPWFPRSRATWWLTTVTHHDLHHRDVRHNYGLYFSIWDKLFGTESPVYLAEFDKASKPWLQRRDDVARAVR